MKLQNLKRQMHLQEWASQIKAQSQSGMTIREWCEATGIGYKNFYRRRKCVQEELLESLEEKGNNPQTTDLSAINEKRISTKNKPAVITPVNIPQTKGAALTVWIGHYAVDIQNGADAEIIDRVLRLVSVL